jgi:hypothetical protein
MPNLVSTPSATATATANSVMAAEDGMAGGSNSGMSRSGTVVGSDGGRVGTAERPMSEAGESELGGASAPGASVVSEETRYGYPVDRKV